MCTANSESSCVIYRLPEQADFLNTKHFHTFQIVLNKVTYQSNFFVSYFYFQTSLRLQRLVTERTHIQSTCDLYPHDDVRSVRSTGNLNYLFRVLMCCPPSDHSIQIVVCHPSYSN